MATFFGVIAIFLWGLLALLGSLTKQIPAFQLLFLCFSLSALIMFLSRLIRRKQVFQLPALNKIQWLAGIAGLFGYHFCYFMALKLAPAIEVSLIAYLWPLLLSVMVANPGNRIRATIGGGVGFIGVVILISGGKSLSESLDHGVGNDTVILGYLLSLVCAAIWSSYSWFLSLTPSKVEDIGWLSLVVAAFSLIAHFGLEDSYWELSIYSLTGVLLLGLGPVGGAFYLWDMSLKNGNRQLLASISFCTPLISAVILALAGLNDWSIYIVIALSLVLLGAFISNQRRSTEV